MHWLTLVPMPCFAFQIPACLFKTKLNAAYFRKPSLISLIPPTHSVTEHQLPHLGFSFVCPLPFYLGVNYHELLEAEFHGQDLDLS